MKLVFTQETVDEVRNNKLLQRHIENYTFLNSDKAMMEYLDENPEFAQMLYHLAETSDIQIVDED